MNINTIAFGYGETRKWSSSIVLCVHRYRRNGIGNTIALHCVIVYFTIQWRHYFHVGASDPDGCQETVVKEHGNGSLRAVSADPWPYTGVFPLEALPVLVCYAIDTVRANSLLPSRRKWYKTTKNFCGEVVLYLLCISHSHFLRFLCSCASLVPGHVAHNRRITCSRAHHPWRRFWSIMVRKKKIKPCEMSKAHRWKLSTSSSVG